MGSIKEIWPSTRTDPNQKTEAYTMADWKAGKTLQDWTDTVDENCVRG